METNWQKCPKTNSKEQSGDFNTGKLYIVATPIGNLKDITLRALEVLKMVDFIACEDTRVSAKLMNNYQISTPLLSYHKFNEKQRCQKIFKLLEEGKNVALISDAGTPCICDPGRILVNEAQNRGVKIEIIPGPSAVCAFLSAVEKSDEQFVFVGFLPKSEKQLLELCEHFNSVDMVFYESANRLQNTLKTIASLRTDDTKIAVGRELTKVFEEIKIGTIKEIINYYSKDLKNASKEKGVLKGEIVAMIYAKPAQEDENSQILDKITKLKQQNISDKDIANVLSTLYGFNKNQVYKLALSAPVKFTL